MLETVDLSLKLEKEAYSAAMDDLEVRVAMLQRRARAAGVPVIVVFEGWDAAGKGTLINRLLLALDPRGFTVHPTNKPNEEERLRPFLWRFWSKTPDRGRIGIFDRSWYGRVLVERVDKIVGKREWTAAYDEIRSFERQLVEDGAVIVKFFLHITKKEQAKRFKKLRGSKSTAWKVTKDDLRRHKQYKKYGEAVEQALFETDTDDAPWTIVEAHDRRHATVRVFETVATAIERKVASAEAKAKRLARKKKTSARAKKAPARKPSRAKSSSVIDKLDLTQTLTREEYDKQKDKQQDRLRELEHEVFLKRLPVMIVYEGCDAAGKGGNIKRLTQGMDPRGYEVIPIAAPNDVEKGHHYLWRFWTQMPKAGHIAIFDRSWYGRVLVERVEGFCTEAEWKRSYREINEMEDHFASFGGVLVKFWLQIGKDEQLARFKDRENTASKLWKITDEDWRNRKKWDLYKAAVDEMLYRTSTAHAPWTVIEANSKWFARVKAMKTVVDRIEQAL